MRASLVGAGSFFFIWAGLIGCTQDYDVVPRIQYDGDETLSYAPLSVGSYWLYKRYEVDTAGNATDLGWIDSCYIAGDTMIGQYTYAIYIRPESNPFNLSPEFLRDSAGMLVNAFGKIRFAEDVFGMCLDSGYTTTAGDTVVYWSRTMVDDGLEVTVPAGLYITKTMRETSHYWPPLDQTLGEELSRQRRYAADVGIVKEDLLANMGQVVHQERWLLDYHIEP